MKTFGDVYDVRPLDAPIRVRLRVPGSKSLTNRALPIAALASGKSKICGALFSEDTHYMSRALGELGISVEEDAQRSELTVEGCGGVIPSRGAELFVGNAGTAMRFLTAILALGHGRFRIDGVERMRRRPIAGLTTALSQLGVEIAAVEGCPPVTIDAQGVAGGVVEIDASLSSQFLSALLLASPYAATPVELKVASGLISHPYVDMTLAVMEAFGVNVQRQGYERFQIEKQSYRARSYTIEPDASAAHYFFAAAALCGGSARIDDLGRESLQGDVGFVDVLEEMGATVKKERDYIEVQGDGELRGVSVDMNAISDTASTLAAIAPFASSPVTIKNVAHIRLQESDRLRAMTTELRRLGARVEEREDGMTVHPSSLTGGALETYDDHRIAMSLAVTGLRTPGTRLKNPGCVAKTFPEFFERIEELG